MSNEEMQREIDRLRRENEGLSRERRHKQDNNDSLIHSKLDSIALDVKQMAAKQAQQSGEIKAVTEDVKVLSTILLGPNGKPEHGIAVRFTNMEESHKNGRKFKLAIGGAAVATFVEAVFRRMGL